MHIMHTQWIDLSSDYLCEKWNVKCNGKCAKLFILLRCWMRAPPVTNLHNLKPESFKLNEKKWMNKWMTNDGFTVSQITTYNNFVTFKSHSTIRHFVTENFSFVWQNTKRNGRFSLWYKWDMAWVSLVVVSLTSQSKTGGGGNNKISKFFAADLSSHTLISTTQSRRIQSSPLHNSNWRKNFIFCHCLFWKMYRLNEHDNAEFVECKKKKDKKFGAERK